MNTEAFEWDEWKNEINIKKHGISFPETQTVFYDENAVEFDDPDHSTFEERFLIIGMSQYEKICIISHCYRDEGDTIRIISARRATKKEREFYINGIKQGGNYA